MKNILLIIILLQGFLFAEGLSIDAEIAKIRSAPSTQERVKLMNAFKMRLSKMHQEERSKLITRMRKKMQSNSHMSSMRENVAHREMQNSQEMRKMENMNQHQVADRVMQREGMKNPPKGAMTQNSSMMQHK